MMKMFLFALVNTSWNSCLTVFFKTLCPISSVYLPTSEWHKRKSDNIHDSQLCFVLINSPLLFLPEAINVEKKFYKVEQEEIKPTWNQKK